MSLSVFTEVGAVQRRVNSSETGINNGPEIRSDGCQTAHRRARSGLCNKDGNKNYKYRYIQTQYRNTDINTYFAESVKASNQEGGQQGFLLVDRKGFRPVWILNTILYMQTITAISQLISFRPNTRLRLKAAKAERDGVEDR